MILTHGQLEIKCQLPIITVRRRSHYPLLNKYGKPHKPLLMRQQCLTDPLQFSMFVWTEVCNNYETSCSESLTVTLTYYLVPEGQERRPHLIHFGNKTSGLGFRVVGCQGPRTNQPRDQTPTWTPQGPKYPQIISKGERVLGSILGPPCLRKHQILDPNPPINPNPTQESCADRRISISFLTSAALTKSFTGFV